ncbi:unnamed protein product [Calypogeia fissa]
MDQSPPPARIDGGDGQRRGRDPDGGDGQARRKGRTTGSTAKGAFRATVFLFGRTTGVLQCAMIGQSGITGSERQTRMKIANYEPIKITRGRPPAAGSRIRRPHIRVATFFPSAVAIANSNAVRTRWGPPILGKN